jgi:RNA polymerase sigma factor (TIGR02999 family)
MPSNATPSPSQVTMLLEAASAGDSSASNKLLPLVYEHLRRLAQSHMNKEGPGQTLEPTALVHEAYIKLVGGADVKWNDRGHFFAAAALAMRRILVDRARARQRDKRGGGAKPVPLSFEIKDQAASEESTSTDLLALDTALDALEREQPRKHRVVMLRYFAGLSIEETAAAMDLSPATVKVEWAAARVWLYRMMNGDADAKA